MKKIKPIKIVVAIATVLVFCVALAVPCFADEPQAAESSVATESVVTPQGDSAMVNPIDESESIGGWFYQLYDIIKEAVFGEDAVLDTNQDFVLTQISLWLTLIVLLLPILVIGVILFRMFIR